jgi:hypothetical protein
VRRCHKLPVAKIVPRYHKPRIHVSATLGAAASQIWSLTGFGLPLLRPSNGLEWAAIEHLSDYSVFNTSYSLNIDCIKLQYHKARLETSYHTSVEEGEMYLHYRYYRWLLASLVTLALILGSVFAPRQVAYAGTRYRSTIVHQYFDDRTGVWISVSFIFPGDGTVKAFCTMLGGAGDVKFIYACHVRDSRNNVLARAKGDGPSEGYVHTKSESVRCTGRALRAYIGFRINGGGRRTLATAPYFRC